jgi:HAMP domain-containing protein
MQWYVYLMTISATAVLGWVALEWLGRPIRALLDLRHNVLEQMHALGNVSPPSPREMAVSSREIHEYDEAMKTLRYAQSIFRELGSQLLAFCENEPVAANAVVSMGLHPVAAGSALIGLSAGYSRPDIDRAQLRNQIETALRLS